MAAIKSPGNPGPTAFSVAFRLLTLRMTPAMAADVTKRLWEMSDVCGCAGGLGGRKWDAGQMTKKRLAVCLIW
jgi:hypothetical protein